MRGVSLFPAPVYSRGMPIPEHPRQDYMFAVDNFLPSSTGIPGIPDVHRTSSAGIKPLHLVSRYAVHFRADVFSALEMMPILSSSGPESILYASMLLASTSWASL